MSQGQIRSLLFWAASLSLFLVLISPQILSRGLFMDGTIYAAISSNMAEGSAGFWTPHLSTHYMNEFYEHPTLGMWMESLLFSILGDQFWVEKIFGLLITLLSMWVIHKVWAVKYPDARTSSWFPVLLWIITPLVFWSVSNNMLESPLILIVILAYHSLLRFSQGGGHWRLIFAGLLLAASLLTKGFVGLFLWSYFFWEFIARKDKAFVSVIWKTAALLIYTMAPILILYYSIPEAAHFIDEYLDVQVFRSIREVQTVDHRFAILFKLAAQLVPMILVCLCIHFLLKRDKHIISLSPQAKLDLLLGLSAVLPLMITLKQRGFYLLPSLPFFAMAFAGIFHRRTAGLVRWADRWSFRVFTALLFILGIVSVVHHAGEYGREEAKLTDLKTISEVLGPSKTISSDQALFEDWHLRAAAHRDHHLHLDMSRPYERAFLITEDDNFRPESYEVHPSDSLLQRYHLLYRITP